MKILLRDVRLAFPSLFKATAPQGGGEPAFSASFLMPPTHPQVAELRKEFPKLAKEKWGAKGESIYKALDAAGKLCLHDGNAKSDYEGFEGNLYVSSRSKSRPTVFDQNRQPVDQASGLIYSGCYVNASIELWTQDNSFGKRINAQLRGVQFLRKGDAFAGGSRPADAEEFPEELGTEGGDEAADDLMG